MNKMNYLVVLFFCDERLDMEYDVSTWVTADLPVSAVAIATYKLGLVLDPRVRVTGAEVTNEERIT